MQKSGQMTMYIIIGIVIVVIVVVIFFVFRAGVNSGIDPDVKPVYDFITSCIEKTGFDALAKTGQHGGYYLLPEFMTNDGVPFYYDQGVDRTPPLKTLEERTAIYINDHLDDCFLEFIGFPDYQVSTESLSSKVIFLDNKVKLSVHLPVVINKGGSSYKFNDFTAAIQTRALDVYRVAQDIVDLQFEDPSILCLHCFVELGVESNVSISTFDYGGNVTVFQIDDLETSENQRYELVFANRFTIT